MKNKKKFALKLKIYEFIDAEGVYIAIPIYNNSEICLNPDNILTTLKDFEESAQKFIKLKLKNKEN